MTRSDDVWIYSRAIRALCRAHGLTFDQAVETYGDRLVHVQCNVVTSASVRACL
jgi:hypothetical protein